MILDKAKIKGLKMIIKQLKLKSESKQKQLQKTD
jgi:hypothetical protein